MTERPHLMTANEAAQWLGLSRMYLDSIRREGRGPMFIRIGIRIYYDQADLVAWLATLKQRDNKGTPLWGAAAEKHGASVVKGPSLVKGDAA